ncbi:MAG: Rrf2 family transcriptional regulator [Clostridiales bacterium]|jgi:Rrf2 family protein|nr:Rrf2 family transcriptional regulator [Clostridiales bacterium]
MRISAKARYGLAAVVSMAEHPDRDVYVTVISLSEKLNISKIYLEQVFALLKRGGVVVSTKGAQGGYQLARRAEEITAYDVLSAVELALVEQTNETVRESDECIENAMRECVFGALDGAVKDALTGITLRDVADKAEQGRNNGDYMYYL